MGLFPVHDFQRVGFHPDGGDDVQGNGMEGEVGHAEKYQCA